LHQKCLKLPPLKLFFGIIKNPSIKDKISGLAIELIIISILGSGKLTFGKDLFIFLKSI